MLDHSFAISELNRKLANIIRIGLVKEIDCEKAKVRVKIGDIVTDYLPWITSKAGKDRDWSPPDIDEQVVVFSPFGELSLGVVLPGIYQEKYPALENKKEINSIKFQDGTKFTCDKEKHHLEIEVVDKITLKAGESSIEMTKSGIKLKAERIDLN
ncbi:MAG: phage baseplate assembly protein V [Wolbachia pipientis]